MKRYRRQVCAFGLSLVILLAGAITVFASGNADGNILPEYAADAEASLGNPEIMEETLAAQSRMQSSPFLAKKGNTISISISTSPANGQIRYGIITPSGVQRFAAGSGEVFHTFDVTEDGSYRVFVDNQSMFSVHITLVFMVNESTIST